ncbi:MAG TPA: CusA/CzcA family heavy metal efflux RND transporter [Kofleriaceae bacterium]|nr:CusA/CzcA family heavy metal efflux RND transporter [Kofleriaceae bacterium]
MTDENDAGRTGVLARVVAGSARNPILAIALVAALSAWGWHALRKAPLDALPDLSDTQVIVLTEWPGQSPDLVEDQVTYPISSALLSAAKVELVRGQSFFGLSFVYVIFEDGTDLYWARSRVVESLARIQAQLPAGATPTLGPDATGVGWVFQYALKNKPRVYKRPGPAVGSHRHKKMARHDEIHERLADLRSLQDWNLRYALESVPGVAEVATVGGMVKELEVRLDPARLRGHGLGVEDVARAVRGANLEIGGRTLDIAEHEHVLRGRGSVKTPEDIASTLVATGPTGTPILVRDLGQVVRTQVHGRGVADLDGEGEVVGGIVIMRYGENALDVIAAVKQRIEELRAGLPDDVALVVTYDRSELIEAAIETLEDTLIEEMIAVSLIIFLFLLHVRSALVPILTLPVAVLLSFIPMLHQGLTINIMSLGGIVVAIGAMMDASIVLIENVHQKLAARGADRDASGPGRREAIIQAMQEVASPIFFSLLVSAVAFMPVFTLEGTEGRLFRPLAFTKTYSMGFAALLSVTLTPALAALFIRGRVRRVDRNLLNRALVAAYTPVVRFVIRRRALVIGLSVGAVLLTIPAVTHLGSEFMPPLNEGVILHMPTAPHGISMAEASRVLQRMDRQLRQFPEVVSVFGKMGRAETATDPAPMGMAETLVVLKPRSEWRDGLTWDDLIREMDEQVRYPGMPNIWWMPIQTRTEMLSTGVRSPLGIQVFGDDIAELEQTAVAIERAVGRIPGTRSAFAERPSGGFFLDVDVKRDAIVRHGLRVEDVLSVVEAIGGRVVSRVVDGRERHPITLRYDEPLEDDPQRIGQALVRTPGGGHVPLSEVADIRFTTGPAMIHSEDGKLVVFVFVDTDRPIADFVAEAKQVVGDEVELPAGVRLGWAGQFQHLERARDKLQLVLPIALALIVLLFYWNTRSLIETGIVLLAVPFSLVGAFWLLFLLDYNMSVAVWVGLIALAGLDAETGVVMLLFLKMSYDRHRRAGWLRTEADLDEAIVEGAAKRIRPKLMTVMTAMIGLLPVLWSTGTGSDVMRRIAAPMVGGLVSSLLLELTVYPAIFAVWKRRALRRS